jgi:hypothetical protein
MRTLSSDLVVDDLDADTPAGRAARHAADRRIQETKHAEFHALDLVLDVDHRCSPVVAEGAGERLPHAWLPDGRSLYDALGPGLTLLTRPGVATTAFTRECARRGVPLAAAAVPGEASRRLPADAVLVRPDQHVAWRGPAPPDDPGPLLDRVVGRPSGTSVVTGDHPLARSPAPRRSRAARPR